jgi:transcriptional regulator with PAS, ATPase and Fis domain
LGRGPRRSTSRANARVLELSVPDGWMSKAHAELVRGPDGWLVRDLGSKNGSFLDGLRLEAEAQVSDESRLQLGRTFFCFRAELPASGPASVEARELPLGPDGLATFSQPFGELVQRCEAAAHGRVTILLRGESGSGKEVLARAVHGWSGRPGAFVPVNCGAIPRHLVESELFGHRKGAFSGAERDRPGLVQASSGGTLFLDELGDLPLASQAAFLRVLQEGEVTPVGASRAERIDLRVVAATHRDLDQMVRDGVFRLDLLSRLRGVVLELLPLRERLEDVALLIPALLRRHAPAREDVKLSPEAAALLLAYDWPLNVRELEQALAGALALSGKDAIAPEHLPAGVREAPAEGPQPSLSEDELKHRDALVLLLRQHQGNLAAVGRALGKGRTQVVRWVGRYRLDPASFRSG